MSGPARRKDSPTDRPAPPAAPERGRRPPSLELASALGNQRMQRLLARAPGDSALALGMYKRVFVVGLPPLPAADALVDEAEAATGLKGILLNNMEPAMTEAFDPLWPSGLASGTIVQSALEGGDDGSIKAIYLNTAGVDLLRGGPLSKLDSPGHLPGAGGQTAAEYRSLVSALAAGSHRVDVYIRHERGLSVVRAGAQVVEGAPLPASLRPHLPPSFFPEEGGTVPHTPPVRGGRMGGTGARAVGGAAASLGLSLLLGWLRANFDEGVIEQQVEELQPYVTELLRASLPIGMERALREPDEAMYATVVYRITWTSAARTEVDPPFQDLPVVHREDVRVEWSDAPKDRDLGRGHEIAGFAIFDWVEVGHSILLEELIEHFLGPDAHVAFATERGKDKPLRPSGLSHVTSKPHEDPVTPPRTAE